MRVHLRLLLLLGFLAVLASIVLTLALADRGSFREQAFERQRIDLERSLRLAEAAVEAMPFEPQAIAVELARRTGMRATLVDEEGVVLGESDVRPEDLPGIENHGDRPEVEAAMAGETAFATRASGTLGIELLYGALLAEPEGRRVVLRLATPLEGVEAAARSGRRAVQLALVTGVLLSLLLAHVIARWVAAPVAGIVESTRGLAAGAFSTRAPRRTRIVEIDALAHGLNRLAEELDERVRDLTRGRDEVNALVDAIAEGVIALTGDARVLRMNRAASRLLDIPRPPPFAPIGTLVRQPELRDLLEASVVRALETRELVIGPRTLRVSSRRLRGGGAVVTFLDVSELRRIERVRRDFVANASHELKTPLTAMRGYAEALLEADPPPEMRRKFLDSILQNTLRLHELVDDLLDLSRLEAGAWSVEREELELGALARVVWEECGEHGEAGARDFEVEGGCTLLADRRALARIFRNLFENAIRHTPEGGRIRVEVRERDGWVSVAVRDNGSGIPSAALPRVFERFYRADPARARVAGGSGLGLAIVRHLVSSMGGDVAAESELGVGTTIRFGFPTDAPAGARGA